MFFVLISIHLNHFLGNNKILFFLFYSMLIGFFERAGAGVDTDRLACIFLDSPNVHLGYDSRMCQTCQDKYQNRKFISATTHRSRKLATLTSRKPMMDFHQKMIYTPACFSISPCALSGVHVQITSLILQTVFGHKQCTSNRMGS